MKRIDIQQHYSLCTEHIIACERVGCDTKFKKNQGMHLYLSVCLSAYPNYGCHKQIELELSTYDVIQVKCDAKIMTVFSLRCYCPFICV